MSISESLIRFLSNAGIMVAASAFIATVNQDVFRQLNRRGLNGSGPRIRVYDSGLSTWIRGFTLIVGWLLFITILVFALICITQCDTRKFAEYERPILTFQVIYYGFLALILALTCFLRISGPDNDELP